MQLIVKRRMHLPACGTAGKSVVAERERGLRVLSNCTQSNWHHLTASS